ncbi:MAG: SelB C-terminal domain-containing protein, partial [Gemmatimonadota bacterium]|nr:SelB C-terminal domain-containing protein [Gemmatimonadota bacterium]
HRPRLSEAERRLARRLADLLDAGGLAPPGPAGLAEALGADRTVVQDLLRLAAAAGEIVFVNSDLVVNAAAEQRLRAEARAVLEREEPAGPAAFAQALGLTRRQLIPLLEHLDREGCTERTGKGRVRGPAWRQSR